MHPQRVLVKEGELKCLKKGKAKKYYYYQFNDLFLFGTLTKGKYSLSRMFRFSELVLQQQQDSILMHSKSLSFSVLFFWNIRVFSMFFVLNLSSLKNQILWNLRVAMRNICWNSLFQRTRIFFSPV